MRIAPMQNVFAGMKTRFTLLLVYAFERGL
jgi:hypothetical protein